MSDEIVRRLMRKNNKIKFLNEGVKDLYEADEDDEDAPGADDDYKALNDEESEEYGLDTFEDEGEEEHEDSQAPIQGTPDKSSSSHSPSSTPDFSQEDDEEVPEDTSEPDPDEEENKTEYENPLDNQYAVKFTLGDEVGLTSLGPKNSDLRKGVIDGYDPEGFYKVKWSDDSTTNGLTDIALESLVKNVHESNCVCGSNEFVEEDGYTVCDKCGRKIRESKEDPLMLADKSRPKGKRMIRSEAHPVSTANKPSIAEAIRKALVGESLREDDDPEVDDAFAKLKTLDNEFWTRKDELKKDIEDLGYIVEEMNDEYVIVSTESDEEDVMKIPIEGTSRTFTINFDKANFI